MCLSIKKLCLINDLKFKYFEIKIRRSGQKVISLYKGRYFGIEKFQKKIGRFFKGSLMIKIFGFSIEKFF